MLKNLIKNWYFGFVIEFRLYIYYKIYNDFKGSEKTISIYYSILTYFHLTFFVIFFLFNVTIRSPYYITFSRLNDLD